MSLSIALSGAVNIQLTEEARPMCVPVDWSQSYTQKAMQDFLIPSAVSNVAVGQGSVTAPRMMLVWVMAGSVSLCTSVSGTGAIPLVANPTPPPADQPSLVLMTYGSAAVQWYYTTTIPNSAFRIWLFQ